MKNKEALKLLDQLIEFAEIEDHKHKNQAIANHQAEKAVGESWMIHHLRLLKKLLEEE